MAVFFFFGLGIVSAQDNLPEETWNALESRNLLLLHTKYRHATKEQKTLIENALYSSLIDLDKLTYEELRQGLTNSNDNFETIIQTHLLNTENEILREISKYSAEELIEYIQMYPQRKILVDLYLSSVVQPNVDSISYEELSYLNRLLPTLGLEGKLSARENEKKKFVRERVWRYCKFEKEHTEMLKELLTIACHQYLGTNYKKFARDYAKIGIVPDNGSAIEKQYRGVIARSINAKDMQNQIKKIVDGYCASINSARAEYAKEADISGYPQMSIQVPEIKAFPLKFSNDLLSKIPIARRDFVDSRKTAGTVANVASWLGLGFVAHIGKGLYDMYAVGELADKEINARKEMMGVSYEQMKNFVEEYTKSLKKNIEAQVVANNNKFVEYVSSK